MSGSNVENKEIPLKRIVKRDPWNWNRYVVEWVPDKPKKPKKINFTDRNKVQNITSFTAETAKGMEKDE